MSKIFKNFFFILIFFTILNCSFDKKTGFWKGDEKEKERIAKLEKEQKNKEIIKIYSSEKTLLKEITSSRGNKLSSPSKNLSWEMAGLNNQNFTGNIFLSGIEQTFLKKKKGKNKYKLSKIISSPLITNDDIIYSDNTGTIFSINKNGVLNWKKNIYKKIHKKIYKNLVFSMYKNKIFVADNIGFIYAITVQTGELVWIKNHGTPIKSNIQIYKNKIFLINQNNRILCLSIKEGKKIWDIRSAISFIKSQNYLGIAISNNGYLIVLTSTGDLIKLQADTGQVYWNMNVIGSTVGNSTDFFKSSNIILKEDAIFFSALSTTYSYDMTTGLLNWSVKLGSHGDPIIDGDNTFIVTDDGYFLNIETKSGKIISSENIFKILKRKRRDTKISGFIMGSNKIYATTINGYLIVSSASNGKVEYFKKIADKILARPIISNGSLYILTSNYKIIGFR